MSTQETKVTETSIMTVGNVRGYIDENGTAWLNVEDVARGLGFTQIAASGNEVVRWERVNNYLSEFNFVPTSGDAVKARDFIPENIFYRLAMKAKNQVAQNFQAKVANEILPTLRKTGFYKTKSMSIGDILILSSQAIKAHEQKIDSLEDRVKNLEDTVYSVSSKTKQQSIENIPYNPVFIFAGQIQRCINKLMSTKHCNKKMAQDIFYAQVAKAAGFVDYYLKACKSKKTTKLIKEGRDDATIKANTSFLTIILERKDLTEAAEKVFKDILGESYKSILQDQK